MDFEASNKIRQYWDQRAEQYCVSPAATTDDIHLRELEVSSLTAILQELPVLERNTVLDVGCGDGYSTMRLAETIIGTRFVGVDFSERMIALARERLGRHPGLLERVAFVMGDALDLADACGNTVFDIVLTDRCLINLSSRESQAQAFAQIAMHTRQGGTYIAIENFVEGHEAMNAARRQVGLPEIPVRWHNLYFTEHDFLALTQPFFESPVFLDFASSYYFATRIIYSAMCQMRGEKPDYNHEIHRIGGYLPSVGNFSPIRMVTLRRRVDELVPAFSGLAGGRQEAIERPLGGEGCALIEEGGEDLGRGVVLEPLRVAAVEGGLPLRPA